MSAPLPSAGPTIGTQRLEAFSDGVMAIVITLLVFTIDIPTGDDLAGQLRAQWPSYLAYVIAFLTLGVVWINHHEFFRLVVRTTHGFLLVNVLFLMTLALIPIPTQMLATYWGEPRGETIALVAYGALATIIALMWNVNWFYAVRHGLLDEDLPPDLVKARSKRNLMGTPVYLVGMLLAFVSAPASLAFYLFVSIFYLLPPRR